MLDRESEGASGRRLSTTVAAPRAPLSFAQKRLWFLDQLDGGSTLYNIPLVLDLEGRLDVGALGRSLVEIVERHHALRTAFRSTDGEPYQQVLPTSCFRLAHQTQAAAGRQPGRAWLDDRIAEVVQRPFDLSQGPPFRATLLSTAPDRHVLACCFHHIVSDGWSCQLFLHELAVLYEAYCEGSVSKSPLEPLPLQYTDFAKRQQSELVGEALERQVAYWKEQLAEPRPRLNLPTDGRRPRTREGRGGREERLLPAGLTNQLAELSRRERCTLFMTILAAFGVLLSRYSGQRDLIIGSPIANRMRPDVEGLIGFFVNTLALRLDLAQRPSFRELLDRVRAVCLSAYEHQDMPFEKLVEELNPTRSLSYNPIFQVMLNFHNEAGSGSARRSLGEVTMTRRAVQHETAKFDLSMSVRRGPDGLSVAMEFDAQLFESATASRLLQNYETLLRGIVADPGQAIDELPLLSPEEHQQVLEGFNPPGHEPGDDGDLLLHGLFEGQAAGAPDAPAVAAVDGTWTYDVLNRRANQLACRLQEQGVRPGDRVGICLGRTLDMVASVLGVLKAGAAYVPLDPAYPVRRLDYMAADAGISALLVDAQTAELLPDRYGAVINVSTWSPGVDGSNNPRRVGSPTSVAYVIYTSGSTGAPKGVMVSHEAICRHLRWFADTFTISSSDRMVQRSPLSFDPSVREIFSVLTTGGCLLVAPSDAQKDPALLAQFIRREKATLLQLVPSLLGMLLDEAEFGRSASLRHVFTGAEALSAEMVRSFHQSLGARLTNLYGPTEATVDVTSFTCPRDGLQVDVPIGRPIRDSRVYVLDENRQPVPIGVVGELCISGPCLADGYLGKARMTEDRFVENPFGHGRFSRLYLTGDLVRWRPDGQLLFVGRKDNQAKVRGYRVEPGEIEAALRRQPAVNDARVMVRDDDARGGQLVAYLTGERDSLSISELRRELKKELPEFMVPSAFVTLDRFPRKPNGKLDADALPAPEGTRQQLVHAYEAPRTRTERTLVTLWERILKIDRIGVRDDFFDLGGHSLVAVRLFADIEKAFGRKLPLATIFSSPSVADLAAVLVSGSEAPQSSLVRMQPNGSKCPLFVIHPVGGHVLHYSDLVRRLGPAQPVFGLEPVGLDGRTPPLTTYEAMAAHYIEEMRAVQPCGPYQLAGSSAGGMIAYEMAQQLRAAGEVVGLLGLIDTWGPDIRGRRRSRGWRARYHRLRDRLGSHWCNFAARSPRQRLDYVWEVGRTAGRRAWLKMTTGTHEEVPAEVKAVRRANRTASRSYRPRPYEGDVVLFRARVPRHGIPVDPAHGWQRFVRGRLDIHHVAGYHGECCREPHVRELADKLATCLSSSGRPRLASRPVLRAS